MVLPDELGGGLTQATRMSSYVADGVRRGGVDACANGRWCMEVDEIALEGVNGGCEALHSSIQSRRLQATASGAGEECIRPQKLRSGEVTPVGHDVI